MKKNEWSRREFLELSAIGVAGVALTSCAPAATPAQAPAAPAQPAAPAKATMPVKPTEPPQLPPEMPSMMLYPGKDSKVTNPQVTFQWKPTDGAKGYALEVFVLRAEADGTYAWDLSTSVLIGDTKYPVDITSSKAQGGNFYWCVTPVDSPIAMPAEDKYQLPAGITVNDTTQANQIPLPKRDQLPGQMGFDDGKFYLKPEKNYLEKYFNILKANQKPSCAEPIRPMIPLIFCCMDRYNRMKYQSVQLQPTKYDVAFANAFEKKNDGSILTKEQLEKAVNYYRNADDDTKNCLFGSTFKDIPSDETAAVWIEDAANKIFEKTVFADILNMSEKKMIKIDIPDVTVAREYGLYKPIAIQVVDNFQTSSGSFTLKITASNGESISVDDLQLTEDKRYLESKSPNLRPLDSASFLAELTDNTTHQTWRGSAEVFAGIPMVLRVDPVSSEEGSEELIRLIVRDGGSAKSITLAPMDSSNNTQYIISMIDRADQTLHGQTFVFQHQNANPQAVSGGRYKLTYQGDAGTSQNDLEFDIKGLEYKTTISSLQCLDESNPEWWGDDSISFMAVTNTGRLIQYPMVSRVYGGFDDGRNLTNFKSGDDLIYFRPDAKQGEISGRIIEGSLAIGISIYEHDDLDWVAWVINRVIDYVQSYLEGIVSFYTFGAAGIIIETGLEVSGLNDMRDQAINGMVTGWEIELLHKGQTDLITSGQRIENRVEMAGDESRYAVTFVLEPVSS